MSLPIAFTRDRIAYLLHCLKHGTPIQPSDEVGWTKNDMLALAGACFFGVVSQGPILFPGADTSLLSSERLEFIGDQFLNDIRAAIEFYGQVATNLEDGDYDAYFEEVVAGAIEHNGDGPYLIRPTKGFHLN